MPRVVHFEIHGEDPAKLAAYYAGLFGWKIRDTEMDYWLIDSTGGGEAGIDGGITRRRGPKPTDGQPVNAFVCTVQVPSVDDYFAKAQKLGGTVALPKMPITGIGWIAYAKDPDGNIFGLMQPDPNAK